MNLLNTTAGLPILRKNKNGASTLEMLFVLFSLMMIFLFVITIFLFLLFRSLAMYNIIRTVRIEGIMAASSYNNQIDFSSLNYYFNDEIIKGAKNYRLYLGNIVEKTFARTSLEIIRNDTYVDYEEKDIYSGYDFVYNNPLFQRFFTLNELFYWSDPLKPDSVKEKFPAQP